MTRKLLLPLLACLAVAAYLAAAAGAATENPVFDQVASQVAGRPEQVLCSTAWPEWYGWIAQTDPGVDAELIEGFNFLTAPVIYLNPKICEALAVIARPDGWQDVGPYYAAEAVGVLVHESEHQALDSSDEGVVECAALQALPGVLVQDFGVPQTVSALTYHFRRHPLRLIRVVRQVPNPWLARTMFWAQAWHDVRPAPYHDGPCG